MMCSTSLRALALVLVEAWLWSVVMVRAELVPRAWEPNQINQTLCWWEQPRAALLRDTFYLDGGYMAYLPGFANGTVGAVDRPEAGRSMYMVNFTRAFNMSQNASDVMERLDKTTGAANNLAPEYLDGAIMANDHELYLYGGLVRATDSQQAPPAGEVLGYERFQFGPNREAWSPGFYRGTLPEGVTRYVTAGASVNVPSENLAFYFSGMRQPDGGEIRIGGQARFNATAVANTMIAVDMSVMRRENWTNSSLPSTVPGRAGAELAWIPAAGQGALVAIGGVVNPESAFRQLTPARSRESEDESPEFMNTVAVYDIEGRRWYTQETSGDRPPQLTQFCSVVASARDGSSHNIYIYGGYSGLDPTEAPSDDVYVLSVPSFVWVKVYTGTERHGRRSHRCVKPYPDQMLVVGGQARRFTELNCLEGGVLQMFNLNSLEWQDRYDPTVWSEYRVPGPITAAIGGGADGGATLQPARWGDNALRSLLGAAYTGTVATYYPYASAASSPTDSPQPTRGSTATPSPERRDSGLPSWVAPVLGVLLGLLAFVVIAAFLIWRRRRRQRMRRGSRSDTSTAGLTNNFVFNWLQGTPPAKDPTVTSTTGDPPMSIGTTALGSNSDLTPKAVNDTPAEIDSRPEVHELPGDNTTASEMPVPHMEQLGLSPALTMQQQRPRGQRHASNPSTSSSIGAGIPRAESPTAAEYAPGHRRQVSSLDSGFPSPASTATLHSGDRERERGNPMDEIEGDLVSPVSQTGRDNDRAFIR